MPVELTDKMVPKNNAFTDIVDAKNVGGNGTSSNALQADAVASPAALEIVRIDSTNQYLEGIATVPVGSGGTGATTLTGYVKGSGTSALTGSATIPGTDISGDISGNAANVTGTVAVGNGGTGATTLTGYVKGSGTSALTASATIPGTDVSGNISGNAANVTGTVAVGNGGTGATTLTGYVKGSGTSALTGSATIPGTDVSGNISGNAANVTGTVAVGNGGTGATTLTGYVKGSGTSALTASATIPGTDVSGNISGNAANVTGTVAVGNGGTGATTLTGYVKGSGTSALTASATIPGTDVSGNISGNAANVTGTVAVGNGGTGATTLTGYVKGSGTSALTASATIPGTDVSGNISGNAANVTGTVAVANGGTGQTTANAALNALLPSQATNTGKFLQTDGTNTSWQTATGGSISGLTAGRVPYASNSTTLVDDAGLTYDATTDALTAGIFQQATNNAGGFYGKGTTANDYRVFVNGSNEWEIRQNVGGVLNASYKFGNANFYCEGAEDLGITTKGFGALWLKGATSGESKLVAPATGGGTATLFGGTDTVCGIAASQTLTNKTLTSPIISTISNTGTVTLPTFNATVGGRVASYDGTALTATASNQLLASAAAGFYRISVFMICTRAATGGGASSTLGANTAVAYTPVGASGPITHYIPMFIYGSALNVDATGTTVNFVDTVLAGSVVMYIASTSVVTYSNGYTSTGTGTAMMRYNVSVRLERID